MRIYADKKVWQAFRQLPPEPVKLLTKIATTKRREEMWRLPEEYPISPLGWLHDALYRLFGILHPDFPNPPDEIEWAFVAEWLLRQSRG